MKPGVIFLLRHLGRREEPRPSLGSSKSSVPEPTPSSHRCNDVAMRTSVVVPTYRRPEALSRCLDALVHQNTAPDEIIIVTATSSDIVCLTENAEALPLRADASACV